MTEINAVAGRRVAIVRRALSSVPMDYRFSARAAIPGQVMGGSVEVRKSSWIFPGQPVKLPLQENNVVSAGLWNTFMSVDVVPDVDVVITTGSRIRGLRTILLLAFVVIAIAIAVATIVISRV